MPGKQTTELYCLCWNDARMLPFFFRHYDGLVDKYFIYDNGSTDGSLSLLERHGRVEIFHFDVTGDSFVEVEQSLGDNIWKGSKADWVIITDIDEHVYRPNLNEYLLRCTEQGITAIQSIGYEMVSDRFPEGPQSLAEQVTLGTRSTGCDRLCIFNPRAITETNFTVGRHEAEPEGRVTFPAFPEVLLLHYKQLGVEYPIVRTAELRTGLRSRDLAESWGVHYTWSPAEITARWHEIRAAAAPVPGLGDLKHISPIEYFKDDRMIAQSGLLDDQWYLSAYPDVDAAGVSPCLHYCTHGWREGRRPNFYFEPDWYRANYAATLPPERNPFCDYLARGENEDACPSPRFDTGWYRARHRLGRDQSPMRHYLIYRLSGLVSPLPDFDVVKYCHEHPDVLPAGKDPFEDYCQCSAARSRKPRERAKASRRIRRKRRE